MAIVGNQELKDEQGNAIKTSGGGGPGSTGSPSAFGAAQPSAPKGSGRFTNLQTYLNANQGAGERLGSGIGQQVQKGFDPERAESKTQTEGLRSAFDQAGTTLKEGQGILGQIGGAGFDATAFAGDQKNLENVARFKQGMGVDERALNEKQSLFDINQQNAMQSVEKRLGQAGSEEGRFGLLKETYGGKAGAPQQYSTGQQRLDQLFLQAGAGDQIRNLQQGIQARQGEVQAQGKQVGKFGEELQGITKQEGELATTLGGKTKEMADTERSRLEAMIDPYNTKRGEELDFAKNQVKALTDDDPNTVVDPNWMAQQGLQSGQRTYGAINASLTPDQIAVLNEQKAQQGLAGIGQVAGQSDIDKLNAVMRISGGSLNPEGKYQDIGNQVTKNELGQAVTYKTGKESLAGRVAEGENQFQQALSGIQNPLIGSGNYGGAGATESQRIQDYLYGSPGQGIERWNSSQAPKLGGVPGLPKFNTGEDIRQENYTQAEGNAQGDLQRQREDLLRSLYYDQTLGSGGVERGNFNPMTGQYNVR